MKSRSTFSSTKNYMRVDSQMGVPSVDNETNEAQDILLVQAVEGHHSAVSALVAAVPDEGTKPLYAAGTAWEPYVDTTTDRFLIRAGAAFVDGYRVELAADLDLTSAEAGALDFTPDGALPTYGVVYADFVYDEIDTTEDPEIATPGIGETTTRTRVRVTFGQVKTATASLALSVVGNVWSGVTPLAAAPAGKIWKNNTARIVLFRYVQEAASPPAASGIVDLRQPIKGEEGLFYGNFESFVTWDAASGTLQITGAHFRAAGGPLNNVFRGQTAVAALTGAGNADGTPVAFDGTGWTIADGEAVGWLAVGVPAAPTYFAQLRRKGSLETTDPNTVTTTLETVRVQQLVVQPHAAFSQYGDAGTKILAWRVGNDLHWFNGAVTRGHATAVVVDNPNRGARERDLVITSTENATRDGVAMNGVEAALSHLASGVGAGALGTARSVMLRVRRGAYDFTRKVRVYGTAAEVSSADELYDVNSNVIELAGDGSAVTKITLRNTEAVSRSADDHAILYLRATKVALRGLSFEQVASSTFAAGRLLSLEGAHVILEDCVFHGPVHVRAARVSVRNCTFLPVGNTSYDNFASTGTGTPWVASGLHLESVSGTTEHVWDVDNCRFSIADDLGVHGALIIEDDLGDTIARVTNCKFSYTAETAQPSIAIVGRRGQVDISACRFLDAEGWGKTGDTLANVIADVPSWYADYKTVPMENYGNGRITACAYVSVTNARDMRSRTSVDRCYFSMGNVGKTNAATKRWLVWGCMLVLCNYTSAESAAAVRVANIAFTHNTCNMAVDDGGTTYDATNVSHMGTPALWGFEVAPVLNDGALITNYLTENVLIQGNVFDLGGESVGGVTQMWRSNTPLRPQLAAVPPQYPAGPLLSMQAHLISVNLCNYAVGVGAYTYANRSGSSIVVANNKIRQRSYNGGTLWVTGLVALDERADYGPSSFAPILLAAGAWDSASDALSTSFPIIPCLSDVVVTGNSVIEAAFTFFTTDGFQPHSPLNLVNCWRPAVVGNVFMINNASACWAASVVGSASPLFIGNQFCADAVVYNQNAGAGPAPYARSVLFAANCFDSCPAVSATAGVDVTLNQTGDPGDNFRNFT